MLFMWSLNFVFLPSHLCSSLKEGNIVKVDLEGKFNEVISPMVPMTGSVGTHSQVSIRAPGWLSQYQHCGARVRVLHLSAFIGLFNQTITM